MHSINPYVMEGDLARWCVVAHQTMLRACSPALRQTGTAWTRAIKVPGLAAFPLPTEHSQCPWPTPIHKPRPGGALRTPVDQSQNGAKENSKNRTEQATEFQSLWCGRHSLRNHLLQGSGKVTLPKSFSPLYKRKTAGKKIINQMEGTRVLHKLF